MNEYRIANRRWYVSRTRGSTETFFPQHLDLKDMHRADTMRFPQVFQRNFFADEADPSFSSAP